MKRFFRWSIGQTDRRVLKGFFWMWLAIGAYTIAFGQTTRITYFSVWALYMIELGHNAFARGGGDGG